jgi:hypothetical protein
MRLFASSVVLACSLLACAGRDAKAPEPRAVMSQRLEGHWLLASFRPRTAFEPMLEGLLRAQLGAMLIQVDDGMLHATGIGVSAARRYEVTAAAGDDFKATLYDERGVPYALSGQFRADRLAFSSLDEPWQGEGELLRRK